MSDIWEEFIAAEKAAAEGRTFLPSYVYKTYETEKRTTDRTCEVCGKSGMLVLDAPNGVIESTICRDKFCRHIQR